MNPMGLTVNPMGFIINPMGSGLNTQVYNTTMDSVMHNYDEKKLRNTKANQ